ncbi:MAG: MFS transporter [Chloroflexota bacterium]
MATTGTEPTTDPAVSQRIDYLVILPLCLTVFTGALNTMGMNPFYRDIADDLGSTVPLIGQTATATMITSGAMGLLVGPLADHFGHRRSLMIGLIAIAVSALGTALAPEYLPLMVARVAGGLGNAMTIGVSLGVAVSRFGGRARLRAMSFIGAGLSSATAVGPVGLASASELIGWRGAFGIVAGIALTAFVMIALLVPSRRRHNSDTFSLRDIITSYAPIVADRSIQSLYLVWTLRAICWFGPMSYLGAYVIDDLGFTTSESGLVYMGAGIGYMTGSLMAGGRLGSLDLRLLSVLALIGMGAGWLCLYAAPTGLIATFGFLAIATLLAGICQITITALMAEESHAPPSTTMVLNESVLSFGAALGTLVGGVLIGFGGYPALGIGLPLAAITAAYIVGRQRRRSMERFDSRTFS